MENESIQKLCVAVTGKKVVTVVKPILYVMNSEIPDSMKVNLNHRKILMYPLQISSILRSI